MRTLFPTAARVALLLAALFPPGVAYAQTAPPSDADRVTARALAHDGYEAQARHQFAQAADDFQRADALVHAPTLQLGLARAQAGLGKLVEAHETYRRIVREPLAPGAPALFARAVQEAGQELAALEPRLGWVTITVRGSSGAAASVTVDDAALPAAALGIKRASDPGEHRVRATAPGFAPAEATFTATEGQAVAVSLAPTPLPEGSAQESAAVAAPSPSTTSVRPAGSPFARTLGYVLLGVGVAGLAGGGVTGVLASTKHASLIGGCPQGHCPPSDSSQVSLYDTLGTVSTVALVGGAVGVASGLTLVWTSPRASSVSAYAGFLRAGIAGSF